jgi:hypothetical protein
MPTATLINCFEVPAGREGDFLRLRERADECLRHAGGYRSTRLHQALTPTGRYQFVNVAELDSVEAWQSVVGGDEFRGVAAQMAEFHPSPALYRVVRSHVAERTP